VTARKESLALADPSVILRLVRVVNLGLGSQGGGRLARVGLSLSLLALVFGCSDAAEFGTHRKSRAVDEFERPDASETHSPDDAGAQPTSSMPEPATSIDEVGDLYEEERCPDAVQRLEKV
jgi:hypothetical protein